MTRPILYPYNLGSASARLLKDELVRRGHRAKRVRPDGLYRPYRNHKIINWGSNEEAEWMWRLGVAMNQLVPTCSVINPPAAVARASNKLTALERLDTHGVLVPEFSTRREVGQEWVDQGDVVVCRSLLRGSGGRGIGLVGRSIEDGDHTGVVPPNTPLYVKYIKKQHEYRVHVFNGQVIDIQMKRRRTDFEDERVNYQIRNSAFGWVFCRDDIIPPDDSITDMAVRAVEVLGLDFGAVDVIWNRLYNRGYVLEVNTAPGLEGTTVLKYADAIEELL